MEPVHRPAVRVICFDAEGRILLLQWQDPLDPANRIWEPPGGGIDPGETPLQAARRELTEETGLDPSEIRDTPVDVERDSRWKRQRYVGREQFFPAFYRTSRPVVVREGLLEYEQSELITSAWTLPADFPDLPGRLEPPSLADICRTFAAGLQRPDHRGHVLGAVAGGERLGVQVPADGDQR
ncbi:NUDIX domain-containing protein [Actinoplanes sp. NPDC051851]|uniref:NUDIX hydrolase n=1 Tax=Actinoplanes sp. NPDC051851 TaxID=3154753 RepID=UPI003411FA2F